MRTSIFMPSFSFSFSLSLGVLSVVEESLAGVDVPSTSVATFEASLFRGGIVSVLAEGVEYCSKPPDYGRWP